MSDMVGYARVSSTSQNLDAQMDALHQAGCTKTFTDTDSGTTSSRPGWEALRAYLRPGDVLVITELSRMTRSLMHLLHIIQELEARQVALQSLREHIDTSTATGRGFLAIMGVIAITMFVGISYLASRAHPLPSEFKSVVRANDQ